MDSCVCVLSSNFFIRFVSAASRSFLGFLDTGAETVSMADDNAVDNADDLPKLLYNFDVDAEEELEEDIVGPEEEPELLVPPLEEL